MDHHIVAIAIARSLSKVLDAQYIDSRIKWKL